MIKEQNHNISLRWQEYRGCNPLCKVQGCNTLSRSRTAAIAQLRGVSPLSTGYFLALKGRINGSFAAVLCRLKRERRGQSETNKA